MSHEVKPVTASDRAMSKKHLKASIKFNMAHAEDHEKAAKKYEKLLKRGDYLRGGKR